MTSDEERIIKLEDKYHEVDKRQDSFETLMKAYIDGNEKRIERIEKRIDQLESNMTNQFHNLLVAGGVGILTIVVTILISK